MLNVPFEARKRRQGIIAFNLIHTKFTGLLSLLDIACEKKINHKYPDGSFFYVTTASKLLKLDRSPL